jgi:hypothetical protein
LSSSCRRFLAAVAVVLPLALLTPAPAGAQDHAEHARHTHPSDDPAVAIPAGREASGTAWLPDESPMHALHRPIGPWDVMLHGNMFLQYLAEDGFFGGRQFGSINWFMAMGRRPLGAGTIELRGMMSLEPFTIGGCGYPDMLASGELCEDEPIHEKQHPHDLVMEAAVEYSRPIGGSVGLQVYGGPVAEPALGPVAFPHRLSALPNPIAPISHHWLDATHVTFGVVTAGVYGRRWKIEGSAFNGREPDEHRTDFDFGALDSYSGRLWFLPAPRWAFQVSAGHLEEAEGPHEGRERIDKRVMTASATYHRPVRTAGFWASTIAWGNKQDAGSAATNFVLAETTVTLNAHDTWFGRAELGSKTPHDISIHGLTDPLGMGKLQGGYERAFGVWRGWSPGIGGSVSASIPTAFLAPRYGQRVTWGGGLFLTLRPARMTSEAQPQTGDHVRPRWSAVLALPRFAGRAGLTGGNLTHLSALQPVKPAMGGSHHL